MGAGQTLPAEQAADAVPRRSVWRSARSRPTGAEVRTREAGGFAVWAYDTHKLPICPLHYDRVLGDEHAELEIEWATCSPACRLAAAGCRTRASDSSPSSPRWCATANASRTALDARGSGAERSTGSALDTLIQEQYWRVAYYGVAGDDINYRRFFNINDLAGLRMELPAVFRHAHARIIPLIEEGTLDGIRLDHVDGLLDPKRYFDDLRAASPRPFYLVIEKILAAHEQLREDWPVEGTTGYEFTNLVLGAMINPAAEESFTEIYRGFTGITTPFSQIVRECKIRIMENEMASELNVLGRDAGRVARQNPVTADFTRNVLQRALKQIVASFPVYRTYIDMDGAPGGCRPA